VNIDKVPQMHMYITSHDIAEILF